MKAQLAYQKSLSTQNGKISSPAATHSTEEENRSLLGDDGASSTATTKHLSKKKSEMLNSKRRNKVNAKSSSNKTNTAVNANDNQPLGKIGALLLICLFSIGEIKLLLYF